GAGHAVGAGAAPLAGVAGGAQLAAAVDVRFVRVLDAVVARGVRHARAGSTSCGSGRPRGIDAVLRLRYRCAMDDARLTLLKQALAGRDDVRLALLFGSHARGRARPESDVDLAVDAPDVDLLALAPALALAIGAAVG